VTSIGWGARHTVAEEAAGKLYLRRYRPLDLAAAAPVRRNDLAATS